MRTYGALANKRCLPLIRTADAHDCARGLHELDVVGTALLAELHSLTDACVPLPSGLALCTKYRAPADNTNSVPCCSQG